MQTTSLIAEIARTLQQIRLCKSDPAPARWNEALRKANAKLDRLAKALPSGSGINCGTHIIRDECKPRKVVLIMSYHYKSDAGDCRGWTAHRIIVTPTFNGISLRITGRDPYGIKEHLYQVYDAALRAPAPVIDWQTL